MREPFDLNTASVDLLCEQFPTLGLFCAEDIVAWREKHGPFTSVEPLMGIIEDPEMAVALGAQFSQASETPPPADQGADESAVIVEAVSETMLAVPEVSPTASSPPGPREKPPAVNDAPSARVAAPEPPSPDPHHFAISPAPVPHGMLPPPLPKPARRVSGQTIALTMLTMANVGFVAGLTSLRHDEQQARVPVAAMSSEVQKLRSTQTETRSDLDESRSRLDEHASKIEKANHRMDAYEARQRDTESALKERDERTTKEVAAIGARVGSLERTVDIDVHNLEEAIQIVNRTAMRDPQLAESASPAPPPPDAKGAAAMARGKSD